MILLWGGKSLKKDHIKQEALNIILVVYVAGVPVCRRLTDLFLNYTALCVRIHCVDGTVFPKIYTLETKWKQTRKQLNQSNLNGIL